MSDDAAELAGYVDVWWQAVDDFCALLEELPEEEWSTPTDLAGWDVKACAAHTAHLESILAGAPEETAEVGEPAHVTGLMGLYTEIGVVNRRDASPDAIITEIRESTTKRHTQLLADPPADGDAKPQPIFGGVPWTWRTLLRNRPLDVWMHEQDVRRAVGRPGGMDRAPARHTAEYLAESLGYVLAKKAAAPPGTSLLLDVEGSAPFAFAVGEDKRGRRLPVPPVDPTVTLRLDRESFICLAGGRRAAEPGRVRVEGDQELGARVVSNPGHDAVRAAADTWQVADIPDQAGRTVLVTGTTLGGLGHHTALELARRGARVVLAGRTPARLDETRDHIRAEVPQAQLEQLEVDLADLEAVRRAAEAAAAYGPIDVLVNNAGVMGTSRTVTGDGLDLQLATNHFGPFLLTGLLLPQLLASKDATVVTVSSNMHRVARRAPLGDPHQHRGLYRTWQVYGQSKLANLLFTHELDLRAREQELPLKALAAHPGFAGTHLAANGQYGRSSGGIASILDAGVKAVSQPAAHGAWPLLMAATADLPGATYVGPGGLGEMGGHPRVVGSSRLARDPEAQRRLWELSEETTGIRYP